MELIINSSVHPIDPSDIITNTEYQISDFNIIPGESFKGFFNPKQNNIEFFVYDYEGNLLHLNYDFKNWDNYTTYPSGEVTSLTLDPKNDLSNLGFTQGKFITLYNFINYELGSSQDEKYFIQEISSDRTELRIRSNFIEPETINIKYNELRLKLDDENYFDEFYLGFGLNQNFIATNILIEDDNSILIKLYNPLPPEYSLKDEVYIFSKVGETIAYLSELIPELIFDNTDLVSLKGPNFSLPINDFVNNSKEFKSQEELITSDSIDSESHLQNYLKNTSNYYFSDFTIDKFSEFIHFSSAKSRIQNFYNKIVQLFDIEEKIDNLIDNSISNSEDSVKLLEDQKLDIIKNFDYYEYFLYYKIDPISSYPKDETTPFPHILLHPTSSQVLEWLGSDIEDNPYYGGILKEASYFDENNPNWLYYTIPEFIRDNQDNQPYIEFCNLIGQHFDEIWLYTKAISEKMNTTNELDKGIPLRLAEEALKSLGFGSFNNNFSTQDLYIDLLGENNKYYLPPTGSEDITKYIAINGDRNFNHWDDENNPSDSSLSENSPYSIERVSQEVFKRLYHNMIYLVKKKGTISGLRQLINIWGIPSTILRIREFGGQNKDFVQDYDDWYTRYSYAYTPVGSQSEPGSLIKVPWSNLTTSDDVPDTIFLRFKTFGPPLASNYSQSIISKTVDGSSIDFGINLYYDEDNLETEYEDWGTLRFQIGGTESNGIYLPFYNKDWWGLMLKKSGSLFTLSTQNKPYLGPDGNKLGFSGSIDLTANTTPWLSLSENEGIFIGGIESGSLKPFSGSYQELRYYSYPMSGEVFQDYVANPESVRGIELTGSLSSYELLNFRAPLGNELEYIFRPTLTSSHSDTLESLHPSSINNVFSFSNNSSEYTVYYYENTTIKTYSKPNTEVYLLNNPVLGTRSPVNNKIQTHPTQDYSNNNTLYKDLTIQIDRQVNESFTKNTNDLEVAFSPQQEINDDITQTYGNVLLSNYLADPKNLILGEDYNPLKQIAKDYFKKYSKGNIYDYIRLIKYFDNSLFKAIKHYVPARTNLSTGLVIKPHYLERSRYKTKNITSKTKVASTSGGVPILFQNLLISQNLLPNIELEGENIILETNYKISPYFVGEPIEWKPLLDNTIQYYNGEIDDTTIRIYDQSRPNPFFNYQYSEYQYYFNETVSSVPFNLNVTSTPITINGVDWVVGVLPPNQNFNIKCKFQYIYNVPGGMGVVGDTILEFGITNNTIYIKGKNISLKPNVLYNIEYDIGLNSNQFVLGQTWKPYFKTLQAPIPV